MLDKARFFQHFPSFDMLEPTKGFDLNGIGHGGM
jgi:hypothetical protein